tara:strand:+ start:2273 stop:2641 length:369 start_codon:yes stop_codon:yes gene_type:complete
MFKIMILSKRKPGMSEQDLIAYYEGNHAPVASIKVPNMKRYVRHFLHCYGNDVYSTDPEEKLREHIRGACLKVYVEDPVVNARREELRPFDARGVVSEQRSATLSGPGKGYFAHVDAPRERR